MSKQMDIFAPPSDLDQAFLNFHARHPEVFAKIVEMTKDARQIGRTKLGMKMLIEVIRWNNMLERNNRVYLNNSYTSRYVRLIDELHPELSSMFERRSLKS